jgi:hypothetical protein
VKFLEREDKEMECYEISFIATGTRGEICLLSEEMNANRFGFGMSFGTAMSGSLALHKPNPPLWDLYDEPEAIQHTEQLVSDYSTVAFDGCLQYYDQDNKQYIKRDFVGRNGITKWSSAWWQDGGTKH